MLFYSQFKSVWIRLFFPLLFICPDTAWSPSSLISSLTHYYRPPHTSKLQQSTSGHMVVPCSFLHTPFLATGTHSTKLLGNPSHDGIHHCTGFLSTGVCTSEKRNNLGYSALFVHKSVPKNTTVFGRKIRPCSSVFISSHEVLAI